MDFGIWNENWNRNEIWKNNSLLPFFLNLDRIITCLGIWNRFGTDLAIPNIWLFGRLGEKTNYGRHPLLKREIMAITSQSFANFLGVLHFY